MGPEAARLLRRISRRRLRPIATLLVARLLWWEAARRLLLRRKTSWFLRWEATWLLRWIAAGLLRLRRIPSPGTLRRVAALLTPLSGILRHGRPSSSS